MSGGVAYVYDEDGQFASRCNLASVALDKVLPAAAQKSAGDAGTWHRSQTDEEQLKQLLDDHLRWTGSRRARELLAHWPAARDKFVKVFPHEYRRALGEIFEQKQAKMQAGGTGAATEMVAVEVL
jgi:glutamate synthase domain-containing protein 3